MYFAQKVPLTEEEIQKKREEAERKARRGEIDPMHEYAFQVICQVSSILKISNWFKSVIQIFNEGNNHNHALGNRDLAPRADGVHVRGSHDAGQFLSTKDFWEPQI